MKKRSALVLMVVVVCVTTAFFFIPGAIGNNLTNDLRLVVFDERQSHGGCQIETLRDHGGTKENHRWGNCFPGQDRSLILVTGNWPEEQLLLIG